MLINQVINKFYNLYVINANKYLIQKPGGEYLTITYRKKDGSGTKPLLPFIMQQHLEQKKTVGIFAGSYYSKFICFDVDFKDNNMAKWITYKITKTLREIGINDYYISNSGGKGYHVEIFIDDLIPVTTAQRFFNLVINKAEVFGFDGEVEFRPTSKQGVKLPLGLNQKYYMTGGYCSFCDEFEGLKEKSEDENFEYLLNIKKIKRKVVNDILKLEKDNLKFDEMEKKVKEKKKSTTLKKEIKDTEEAITQHKELPIYNPTESYSLEQINDLYKNGLKMQGIRHNACFNIARLFNHHGLDKDKAEEMLKEWMKKQKKKFYSTSLPDALKDIEEIIDYVFTKNIVLTSKKKDISVSFNEINGIIINCPKKNQKLLAYAMLIHSKRFATPKSGVFYMTFGQMEDATGLAENTIMKQINQLEELGIIHVVERNGKNIEYNKELKRPISKPNKYKFKLEFKDDSNSNSSVQSISDNVLVDFKNTISSLYTKKEIKGLLTRREYKYFINSI